MKYILNNYYKQILLIIMDNLSNDQGQHKIV